MDERTCAACGTALLGRIDKKFCSDQCRSTHNNRLNSEPNKYVREINNVLRKNRRILDSLNPGGKVKVSAACLKEKGFDFRAPITQAVEPLPAGPESNIDAQLELRYPFEWNTRPSFAKR